MPMIVSLHYDDESRQQLVAAERHLFFFVFLFNFWFVSRPARRFLFRTDQRKKKGTGRARRMSDSLFFLWVLFATTD